MGGLEVETGGNRDVAWFTIDAVGGGMKLAQGGMLLFFIYGNQTFFYFYNKKPKTTEIEIFVRFFLQILMFYGRIFKN